MTAPRSPWLPDKPDTPNIVPDAPPLPVDDHEVAQADLRIQRDDLGPSAFTLIKAGDVVPKGIAELPRFNVKSDTPIKGHRKRD